MSIGTWIDGLTDNQRDNIITATQWREGWYLYDDGARCLVGHVADVEATAFSCDGMAIMDSSQAGATNAIEDRFDRLVDRFGLTRVVRAIKARAARRNREAVDSMLAAGALEVEHV